MIKIILMAAYVMGSGPICAFDGYNYTCFYWSWEACEMAIKHNPLARCVPRP